MTMSLILLLWSSGAVAVLALACEQSLLGQLRLFDVSMVVMAWPAYVVRCVLLFCFGNPVMWRKR